MEILKRILGNRKLQLLALAAALLGALVLVIAWKMGLDGAALKSGWMRVEDFLVSRPWLLFAGLVILPALPVPTSALLVLAGTVWRDRPAFACLACLTALALNMSWSYWLAAHMGRSLLLKLLRFIGMEMPVLPKANDLKLILIVRLTPGFPFFIQNYVLGFLHVPFRLYLPVSISCSGVISAGLVLSAAGVADGNLVPIISGVTLIIVGLLAVHWIRAKMLKR